MAQAALIWDPALADYDLGPHHPLNPIRLTLTVELLAAYGVLGRCEVLSPRIATDKELMLVHTSGYI